MSLLDRNDVLKNDVTELKKTVNDIWAHQEALRKQEISELKAQYEEKRKEAILAGDIEKTDEIEKNIKNLEPVKSVAKSSESQQQSYNAWLEKNDWYKNNTQLSEFADFIAIKEQDANPNLSFGDILKKVDAAVEPLLKIPEASNLGNPKEPASDTAAVAGGVSNSQTSVRGRTYNDLPQLAKETCERFVKTIPGFKREDFVKTYQWDE